MRIIAGERRGARLVSPAGEQTRPLRDRIREALFSILQPEIHGRHAIDCFAGSGAVGLEALSNGAATCCFIEPGKEAIAAIASNVEKLRYTNRATVIPGRTPDGFTRLPTGLRDLIFLMPPYHSGLCEVALAAALQKGIVSQDCLAVCEVHRDEALPAVSGWQETHRRDYGITRLVFLSRTVGMT